MTNPILLYIVSVLFIAYIIQEKVRTIWKAAAEKRRAEVAAAHRRRVA